MLFRSHPPHCIIIVYGSPPHLSSNQTPCISGCTVKVSCTEPNWPGGIGHWEGGARPTGPTRSCPRGPVGQVRARRACKKVQIIRECQQHSTVLRGPRGLMSSVSAPEIRGRHSWSLSQRFPILCAHLSSSERSQLLTRKWWQSLDSSPNPSLSVLSLCLAPGTRSSSQ